MSIADFNHYTPLGSDPKLSRNYATKKDVERLEKKIDELYKLMEDVQSKLVWVEK